MDRGRGQGREKAAQGHLPELPRCFPEIRVRRHSEREDACGEGAERAGLRDEVPRRPVQALLRPPPTEDDGHPRLLHPQARQAGGREDGEDEDRPGASEEQHLPGLRHPDGGEAEHPGGEQGDELRGVRDQPGRKGRLHTEVRARPRKILSGEEDEIPETLQRVVEDREAREVRRVYQKILGHRKVAGARDCIINVIKNILRIFAHVRGEKIRFQATRSYIGIVIAESFHERIYGSL